MKVPFFIARRYFFSGKNPSAINLITGISVLGYAAGSFILIVLLSALNGFEKVIFDVYDTYYPDIKIEAASGKTLEEDSALLKKILKIPGVKHAAFTLEENGIIQSGDNQVVGLIKGVSGNYTSVVKTDSLVISGEARLADKAGILGWMAEGLIYKLNVGREANRVTVMIPDRDAGVSQLQMMEDDIRIGAMIRPGDELNNQLLIAPLPWVQELLQREGSISAVEVAVAEPRRAEKWVSGISETLGKNFTVRDRKQQNPAVYKMFNTEKWMVFAIISFALLLITFNLVGSLSMLVLEKKRDIRVLEATGMDSASVKRIFFSEGVLVSLAGSLGGLLLGILVVWLQQKYGFIKTQSTFSVIYPVEIRLSDILLVPGLCMLLGITGSVYPALRSANEGIDSV